MSSSSSSSSSREASPRRQSQLNHQHTSHRNQHNHVISRNIHDLIELDTSHVVDLTNGDDEPEIQSISSFEENDFDDFNDFNTFVSEASYSIGDSIQNRQQDSLDPSYYMDVDRESELVYLSAVKFDNWYEQLSNHGFKRPPIYLGPFHDIKLICDQTAKFIFICLLDDESDFPSLLDTRTTEALRADDRPLDTTNSIQNMIKLVSLPAIVDLFEQHGMFWLFDISTGESRRGFSFRVASRFFKDNALNYFGNSLLILGNMEGKLTHLDTITSTTTPENALMRVMHTIEQYSNALLSSRHSLQQKENERISRDSLRKQQEIEYQTSLEQDRLKKQLGKNSDNGASLVHENDGIRQRHDIQENGTSFSKLQANAEAQKITEEKERHRKAQIMENAKNQLVDVSLHENRSQLVIVNVKLPSGDKHSRKFLKEHTMMQLINYIHSLGFIEDEVLHQQLQLHTHYPRRALHELPLSMTLDEAKLDQETVYVSFVDETT